MQIAVSAPVNMASPVMVWRPSSEMSPSAGPPSSSTWEAAGAGAEHAHQMVKDVPRHHAGAERAGEVHPRGLRHGEVDPLADEGLQQLCVDADGERAEGAELRHVAVKVDHEAARHGVAGLGRDLVADPLALVEAERRSPRTRCG